MIKLIRNAILYSPSYLSKKDILICGDKVAKISEYIPLPENDFYDIEIIDADGQYVVPGFIDLHVHIIGGGGEGGFTTRTPEIQLSQITTSGVTTVIGLLGTDGTTRSLNSLLAKAKALENEGINTLLWTGSYQFPTRTITSSPREDIMLIDKIIGVGEIAISDHRGSKPVKDDIERLALECRVAGILSGKCGALHMHVGDDREGIKDLIDIISAYPLLKVNMLPTHINRNMSLLFQSLKYLKKGGYIDLTSGIFKTQHDPNSIDASYAFRYLLDRNCPADHITMSSDGNGSMPIFNGNGELESIGIGSIMSNINEFRKMVFTYDIPMEVALLPLTSNPATLLKQEHIGSVTINRQADLIIMNKDLSIDYVICKGSTMVQHGKPVKYGTFEKDIRL